MSERLRRQLSEASKRRTQQIPKIDRLQEIQTLLIEPLTDPLEKPELELESIWLSFKRGIIDAKTRIIMQEALLDDLAMRFPAGRERLMQIVRYDKFQEPISRIEDIRDRVMRSGR